MAENNLNIMRRKLIDSMCSLSPIFVITIFIERVDMPWWKYVVAAAVLLLAGGLNVALFKRFVCPKQLDPTPITTFNKTLCYITVLIINLVGIFLFATLPFGFVANIILSLLAASLLTMALCHRIAITPQKQ